MRLGVRMDDAVRDLLQDRRLAGLGRRHDHPALALADRRDHVDDPLRDRERPALEPEPIVREERCELVELRPRDGLLGVHLVDRFDRQQRRVLLVVLRFADLARHGVALAELVPAHVGQGHVDVLLARQIAGGPEEAVPLREDVQDPGPGGSGLELLRPILLVADLPLLARTTALLTGRPAPAIPLAGVRGTLPDRTGGALTVTPVVRSPRSLRSLRSLRSPRSSRSFPALGSGASSSPFAASRTASRPSAGVSLDRSSMRPRSPAASSPLRVEPSPLVEAATIASISPAFRSFCVPSTPSVWAICCSSGRSLPSRAVRSVVVSIRWMPLPPAGAGASPNRPGTAPCRDRSVGASRAS